MFSTILKELRAKNGYSQVQLAKMLGVSPGNVGDWETGKSKPGYLALAALARIFEVSSDYLLELDAVPEKKSNDLNEYKQEQGLTCDGSPLSEDEADLIAMFRLLPAHEREDVFDLIHYKYKKYAEKKMGSIYLAYAEESNDKKGESARSGTA